jgi:hypothetical protein
MVTAKGLTITPARDYAKNWRVLESRLRYQATALGLIGPDRRDEAYWQIVEPMFQDLERDIRWLSSINCALSTRTWQLSTSASCL